jgi:hypothetical protein
MGYSRRKEAREIVESIESADRAAAGRTLGALCAAGVMVLDVACYTCPRKGRYRLTRLIDRHGARMELLALREILAGDCPRRHGSYYNRCGAYFPAVVKPP